MTPKFELHPWYCYMYFITGMLRKSAGQTLRVAVCLNVLFSVGSETLPTSDTSSKDIIADAIVASSNFVDICCIQAAYMAGRTIELSVTSAVVNDCSNDDRSNEKLLLLLPGKKLNLSEILAAKKCRYRGGREAALETMANLQADGLGVLHDLPSVKRSANKVHMHA